MTYKRILVSGSHRSGTTWVGKILSDATNFGYIHEPFNVSIHNTPFENWFHYAKISEENPVLNNYINQYIDNGLISNYNALRNLKSKHDLYYFYKKINNVIKNKKSYIIKDPIAFFSLPWLARNFRTENILMIRHPAAFVASLKVKSWRFDFSNLLKQEKLVNDYLGSFLDDIHKVEKKTNIIDEAILLWRIFHNTINKYKIEHSDWIYVRHEDLSTNPFVEFKNIFGQLGLEYNKKTEQIISSTIKASGNKKEFNSSKVQDVKRNSSENILYWKKRLDDNEIRHIRKNVEEISSTFYNADEW